MEIQIISIRSQKCNKTNIFFVTLKKRNHSLLTISFFSSRSVNSVSGFLFFFHCMRSYVSVRILICKHITFIWIFIKPIKCKFVLSGWVIVWDTVDLYAVTFLFHIVLWESLLHTSKYLLFTYIFFRFYIV